MNFDSLLNKDVNVFMKSGVTKSGVLTKCGKHVLELTRSMSANEAHVFELLVSEVEGIGYNLLDKPKPKD